MDSSPGPLLQQPTQLTDKPRLQGDRASRATVSRALCRAWSAAASPAATRLLTAGTATSLCREEKAKATVQHVVASPAEGAQVCSFLSLTAESLLFMKEI